MERLQPGESLSFEVVGKPAPGGSKISRVIYKEGKPLLKDGRPIVATHPSSKRERPWRNDVAEEAVHSWGPRGMCVLDCALHIRLTFFFERAQGDYRKDGTLRPSAEMLPRTRGEDLDKLARSTLDALAGIVFTNDRRVVDLVLARRFGSPERCEITVTRPEWRTVAEYDGEEQRVVAAEIEEQQALAI